MIQVKFVGVAPPTTFNRQWGGSLATSFYFYKAFEGDPEFEIEMRGRDSFQDLDSMRDFLNSGDISHMDDAGFVGAFYGAGFDSPDVIGPITRSPVKRYGPKDDPWVCPYTPEWFYQAKIIRLNASEEKNTEYVDRIHLVNHGVDWKTVHSFNTMQMRNEVLWAGALSRYAKNVDMWQEIVTATVLPEPFYFAQIGNYEIENYWKRLSKCAILVNTSRYESFCCAMFEAKCLGIPTIHRRGLHGPGYHPHSQLQVEYTPEAYRDGILHMLDYLPIYGDFNRSYCHDYASLRGMRNSYAAVYKEVLV